MQSSPENPIIKAWLAQLDGDPDVSRSWCILATSLRFHDNTHQHPPVINVKRKQTPTPSSSTPPPKRPKRRAALQERPGNKMPAAKDRDKETVHRHAKEQGGQKLFTRPYTTPPEPGQMTCPSRILWRTGHLHSNPLWYMNPAKEVKMLAWAAMGVILW
jgi:hypothetical protein